MYKVINKSPGKVSWILEKITAISLQQATLQYPTHPPSFILKIPTEKKNLQIKLKRMNMSVWEICTLTSLPVKFSGAP